MMNFVHDMKTSYLYQARARQAQGSVVPELESVLRGFLDVRLEHGVTRVFPQASMQNPVQIERFLLRRMIPEFGFDVAVYFERQGALYMIFGNIDRKHGHTVYAGGDVYPYRGDARTPAEVFMLPGNAYALPGSNGELCFAIQLPPPQSR